MYILFVFIKKSNINFTEKEKVVIYNIYAVIVSDIDSKIARIGGKKEKGAVNLTIFWFMFGELNIVNIGDTTLVQAPAGETYNETPGDPAFNMFNAKAT